MLEPQLFQFTDRDLITQVGLNGVICLSLLFWFIQRSMWTVECIVYTVHILNKMFILCSDETVWIGIIQIHDTYMYMSMTQPVYKDINSFVLTLECITQCTPRSPRTTSTTIVVPYEGDNFVNSKMDHFSLIFKLLKN